MMELKLEEHRSPSTWSSMKSNVGQLCLQLVQVCIALSIAALGLLVSGIGLWALISQTQFFLISDGDSQLTRIPLSVIVVGLVILVLGLIGVVGAVFMRTITGRILIGVYGFVLVLIVINEIGAGVSAVLFQDELRQTFIDSAQRSLSNYGRVNFSVSTTIPWDKFQQKYECCGAEDFTSYRAVFHNSTVPASCCRKELAGEDCLEARLNATREETNKLYLDGCPDQVIGEVKKYDLVIAVVALVISGIQLIGITLACSITYLSSRKEQKKTFAYNKLTQEYT